MEQDWLAWHAEYDQPGSRLARRLGFVQDRLRIALAAAPPGPLRVLSLVAGQGRDVIGVLAGHPRRDDVAARLVELDPRNVEIAVELARAAKLTGVEVVEADASQLDAYADLPPADVLLLCGLFGNLSDADVRHTISWVPALVARGGTVVWTSYRGQPELGEVDRCDWIDQRYQEHGFAPVWRSGREFSFGVGVHRSERDPAPIVAGVTLFTFVGHERRRVDQPEPGKESG